MYSDISLASVNKDSMGDLPSHSGLFKCIPPNPNTMLGMYQLIGLPIDPLVSQVSLCVPEEGPEFLIGVPLALV